VATQDVCVKAGCVRRCRKCVPMQDMHAAAVLMTAQPVPKAKCSFWAARMPHEQHELQRYTAKQYAIMVLSWTASLQAYTRWN